MVRKKSNDGSGSPTLSRQSSHDLPAPRTPKTSGKYSKWLNFNYHISGVKNCI